MKEGSLALWSQDAHKRFKERATMLIVRINSAEQKLKICIEEYFMKPLLLISPGYKKIYPLIPLSIIALASFLRNHGIAVELLDAHIDDYKNVNFNKYLLVGLSVAVGGQINVAYEITKHIKQKVPEMPVVWGGSLPSCSSEIICKSEIVDIVVRKEGEETLLEVVKCIKKNKPLENVKGITFKKDGKVVSNPDRPFLDMNKLPPPAYDLLDLSKYADCAGYLNIETSRGCPHGCVYCFSPQLYNRLWRAKSAEKIVDEIRMIIKIFSVHRFYFSDNNFFVDKKRVMDFCKHILKAKIRIKWSAWSRADTFAFYTDKELALLNRAGLNHISIGTESGSQRVLDSLKKEIKVGDIELCILKCVRHNISPRLLFMIGIPNETFDDIKKTIKLCKKLEKLPLVNIKGYQIFEFYPNTSLKISQHELNKVKRLEDLVSYELSDYSSLNYLGSSYRRKIRAVSGVTYFLYTYKLFKERGKAFQKMVLGSTINTVLWKIISPLLYIDAKLRWNLMFFNFGYEWSLLGNIAKKFLNTKIGEF